MTSCLAMFALYATMSYIERKLIVIREFSKVYNAKTTTMPQIFGYLMNERKSREPKALSFLALTPHI